MVKSLDKNKKKVITHDIHPTPSPPPTTPTPTPYHQTPSRQRYTWWHKHQHRAPLLLPWSTIIFSHQQKQPSSWTFPSPFPFHYHIQIKHQEIRSTTESLKPHAKEMEEKEDLWGRINLINVTVWRHLTRSNYFCILSWFRRDDKIIL